MEKMIPYKLDIGFCGSCRSVVEIEFIVKGFVSVGFRDLHQNEQGLGSFDND